MNSGLTFELAGYREPSPEEVAIMRKKSIAMRRQDPRGRYFPSSLFSLVLLMLFTF